MSKINCMRKSCKDVFHAFLVKNANYQGKIEIPIIRPENETPVKIVLFSKIFRCNDYDAWVCFYEDDVSFERIWNNPKKYLPVLSKFRGVITPDFSLYRDMPLIMQLWNIYRSRAIGHWLQDNGIKVIVNVRWGDKRTYKECCYGVPKNSVISVGSYGCIKISEERDRFKRGLDYVVKKINPKTIVVFGKVDPRIFSDYEENGIEIIQLTNIYDYRVKKVNY